MKNIVNHFKGYVGQNHVTTYFNRLIAAIVSGANIALHPVEFTGYAGLGKTDFANRLATVLRDVTRNPKAKEGEDDTDAFHFAEMSSAITLPGFMQFWANHVQGRRSVILIDEAQDFKNPKVKSIMKRIMETGKSVKEITHEEFSITSDPFKQLFIFATNEEPRDSALFGPCGRTKQLQFLPFTTAEALQIIKQKATKAHLDLSDAAAEYLVTRVLPNGRAIAELVENDCALFGAANGKRVSLEMAKEIVKETGRFPLGLRKSDIVTLMFIAKDEKGKQIQEIAAAAGGEARATTMYRVQWLAGMNLIRTAGNGRKVLTQPGLDYLETLKKATADKKAAAKRKAVKA